MSPFAKKKTFAESKLNELYDQLPPLFKDAKKEDCKEKGKHGTHPCICNLNNLPNRLILDGDQLDMADGEKSCDCIIFAQLKEIYLLILELKSRNFKATDIEQKYLHTIERIAKNCTFLKSWKLDVKFILVSQTINPVEKERIMKFRFRLFSQSSRLLTKKCGFELNTLLS